MDEQELRSLFSAAPPDAPEPGFTQDDVVRESHRQTVRRRNRITAGVSAAALVVVGFGAYGLLSGGTPESMTAAGDGAMSSRSAPGSGQPGISPARPEIGGESPNFSSEPPRQGGDQGGKTGQLAEGASGCEEVDGELAIALAGELPGHVAGTPAVPGGEVAAAVYPKGLPVVFKSQPAGTVTAEVATASGGKLVLVSVPSSGAAAPYAGQVETFAHDLAARF
ncbi:hypothetical protein SAMN05421837_104298 [Amycolatopsis pretoriensis]|uniref:Uncharacterized protein n=1 Tax=Amycolatopsis pretoriensis TaxID=218821 RepID=A0A1H5QRH4_9PSEU|nr:hypothetical protein [Amycolatopsis pretoriensis]SEF28742.1 hypothetical protein SAMN05421837_104298 [Amycolatopsis pretoriensis]